MEQITTVEQIEEKAIELQNIQDQLKFLTGQVSGAYVKMTVGFSSDCKEFGRGAEFIDDMRSAIGKFIGKLNELQKNLFELQKSLIPGDQNLLNEDFGKLPTDEELKKVHTSHPDYNS
jgi:hypothetical protein